MNIDQFSPITQDRDRIVFSEVAYPVIFNKDGLISNPNQVMSEIRLDITGQVDKLLETSMLPSSFKWFEYVDVKLEIVDDENGVIYCGIGGGINYDYCDGNPCLSHDRDYYESVVGPSSFCDDPSSFLPISQNVIISGLCGPGDFDNTAADFAKNYINRAVIVNGAYAPAPCNGIDPSIFSTDIDVPDNNLIRKNYNFNEKLPFTHGAKYILPDNKILIPSYHPSPRNVNRKIINIQKMVSLLKKADKII